ncbi:MAG: hypothetical protein IJV89_07680 [Lentisphaeria bacterium]|nr:hypothetical protein [Lentisphaeria bacterium]
MTKRDLEKYLRKALIRPVEPAPPAARFRHFIVIPVMDELEELPGTLASLQQALPDGADRPGILLVINHGLHAAPERKAHNLELLELLRQERFPGVLWVDAASPGKELANGVGEARRIGMDTALSLLEPEDPEHAYIVCLDADSHVSEHYWREIKAAFAAHPECGTLSLGVRHRTGKNDAEENAIRKYEKFMDDYVASLHEAGSPYAFHTIGSAMAIRASIYVACGGMRIRSGGEDFYFLQAAAKVAPVWPVAAKVVHPAARPSDRVPFGTGPAVRSLLAGESLEVYPEQGFAALKELLHLVRQDGMKVPGESKKYLCPRTVQFLEERGFFRGWNNVLRNTPDNARARELAFHRWFDALKTLQFIRFFRESK